MLCIVFFVTQERDLARSRAELARRMTRPAYENRARAIMTQDAACRAAYEEGMKETAAYFGGGRFNAQTHEVVEKVDLASINAKLDQLMLAERRRLAKAAISEKLNSYEALQFQRGAKEAVRDASKGRIAAVRARVAVKDAEIKEEITKERHLAISKRLRTLRLVATELAIREGSALRECDRLEQQLAHMNQHYQRDVRAAVAKARTLPVQKRCGKHYFRSERTCIVHSCGLLPHSC